MLDSRKRPREDDDFRGRRDFGGKGKGKFAPRFSKGGGKGSKKLTVVSPVDRQTTCPTLLRVWVREDGFTDVATLDVGKVPEGEEIRTYYWEDTTLHELTQILHEKVPAVGDPKVVMTIAAASPTGSGRYRVKDIAVTKARGLTRENDNLPLARTALRDGDLLLVMLQQERDYYDSRLQRAIHGERQKAADTAMRTDEKQPPPPPQAAPSETPEAAEPSDHPNREEKEDPERKGTVKEEPGADKEMDGGSDSNEDKEAGGSNPVASEGEPKEPDETVVVKKEAGTEEAGVVVKSEQGAEQGTDRAKSEEKRMEEDKVEEEADKGAEDEAVVVKKEPAAGNDSASSSGSSKGGEEAE
ncbi:Histone deacetylase complex subunit SAP18 [Diplonema papillatum]|nr:Histone deacetylase complex subunit SAP18 [Diplonema papillatum]WGM50006.1 SAP18 [Diplonema papillatum]